MAGAVMLGKGGSRECAKRGGQGEGQATSLFLRWHRSDQTGETQCESSTILLVPAGGSGKRLALRPSADRLLQCRWRSNPFPPCSRVHRGPVSVHASGKPLTQAQTNDCLSVLSCPAWRHALASSEDSQQPARPEQQTQTYCVGSKRTRAVWAAQYYYDQGVLLRPNRVPASCLLELI